MHCGEGALCYLAQTHFLFVGDYSWGGGHSEQFNVFGGVRKKMSQIRKIAPAHQ